MAQPKYQKSGTVESKKSKSLQQTALEAPEYKKWRRSRSPTAHENERRAAKESRESPGVQGSEQLGSWDPKDEDFDIHDDVADSDDYSEDDKEYHDDAFYDEIDDFYAKYYEPEREGEFQEDIWWERVDGEIQVRFGKPPLDDTS